MICEKVKYSSKLRMLRSLFFSHLHLVRAHQMEIKVRLEANEASYVINQTIISQWTIWQMKSMIRMPMIMKFKIELLIYLIQIKRMHRKVLKPSNWMSMRLFLSLFQNFANQQRSITLIVRARISQLVPRKRNHSNFLGITILHLNNV